MKKKTIRHELLDELLAGHSTPEEITGPNGLLKQLTGALVERALQAEMTGHLGYEPHAADGRGTGNSRNGTSPKTLTTEQGDIAVEVPRDRNGTFEPQLVKKHQRRFDGFDDKIISMYARGMSVRDIQAHLSEIYGTEVSPDLISKVTDAVVEELVAWQKRPLDAVWPILYLDALVIKVRDQES
jgi:putative transposase